MATTSATARRPRHRTPPIGRLTVTTSLTSDYTPGTATRDTPGGNRHLRDYAPRPPRKIGGRGQRLSSPSPGGSGSNVRCVRPPGKSAPFRKKRRSSVVGRGGGVLVRRALLELSPRVAHPSG